MLHQVFVVVVNPTGVELATRGGACWPLVRDPSTWLRYTNVEVGLVSNVSPAYAMGGAYAQVTPVSPLQLRVELSGVTYFPFPYPRAGYYPLAGYDADVSDDALPAEKAGTAAGWWLNLVAVLRFRAPHEGPLQVFGLSMLSAERWSVGRGDYYFNLRRDLVMARSDWVIANEGHLGVEFPVAGALHMRVGAFDSLRFVPADGYVSNQVGLFGMLSHPSPTSMLKRLEPFLRLGVYTHHAFRAGTVSVLIGTFVSYDLGAL